MKNHPLFDVVIIGAGPAGCGVASGLLQQGIQRIALIDKPIQTAFRIGESATPDVPRLLEQLGLPFHEKSHKLYTGNKVSWGSERVELHDFIFRGQGNGWHLDRAAFDEIVKQSVVSRGVPIYSPDGISTLQPCNLAGESDYGWEIKLQSSKTIQAKIAVDASGRSSAFAKQLGIERKNLDALIALACRVPATAALQGASLITTCETGWWYAANLADGYSIVSLMTDTSIAKSNKLHDAINFKQLWDQNKLLSDYIAAPTNAMAPQTFAAYTGYLQQAAGKKWLAVGDALMGFDPLTSSGISGALSDAVAAIPVVIAQLQHNYNPAKEYAKRANSIFKRYMVQRAEHYSREQRWKEAAFWSARIPGVKA